MNSEFTTTVVHNAGQDYEDDRVTIQLGVIVDVNIPDSPSDIRVCESHKFLASFCAIRQLNSLENSPIKYAGIFHTSVEGHIGSMESTVEMLEKGVQAIVISNSPTARIIAPTVAGYPKHQEVLAIAPTSDIPQLDDPRSWGYLYRYAPSACDSVKAIVAFCKKMEWHSISVIRTLDEFGQQFQDCYNKARKSLLGNDDYMAMGCLNSVFPEPKMSNPPTALENALMKHHLQSIETAIECLQGSKTRVLIIWARHQSTVLILDALAKQAPEIMSSTIVLAPNVSIHHLDDNWNYKTLNPTEHQMANGIIYPDPNVYDFSEYRQCLAELQPTDHPFIAKVIEDVHNCKFEPQGNAEDDDNEDRPQCPADATLANIPIHSKVKFIYQAHQHIHEMLLKHNFQLTDEIMQSSNYFDDNKPRHANFPYLQIYGNSQEPVVIGEYNNGIATIDYSAIKFKMGYSWLPAYAIQDIAFELRGSLAFLIIISMAATALCLVLTIKYRKEKIIRKTSWGLSSLILLGILMCLFSQWIWTVFYYNTISCTIKLWLFCVGLGMTLSALAAKLYRLHAIFNNVADNLIRDRHKLSERHLITHIVVPVIICELFMAFCFTFFKGTLPYRGIKVYDNTMEAIFCCRFYKRGWEIPVLLLAFACNAALALAAIYYAYKTRNIKSAFNETSLLSIVAYIYVLSSIVMLPMYYSLFLNVPPVEENAANRLALYRVIATLLCSWATISVLYIPKLVKILAVKTGGSLNFNDHLSHTSNATSLPDRVYSVSSDATTHKVDDPQLDAAIDNFGFREFGSSSSVSSSATTLKSDSIEQFSYASFDRSPAMMDTLDDTPRSPMLLVTATVLPSHRNSTQSNSRERPNSSSSTRKRFSNSGSAL